MPERDGIEKMVRREAVDWKVRLVFWIMLSLIGVVMTNKVPSVCSSCIAVAYFQRKVPVVCIVDVRGRSGNYPKLRWTTGTLESS